MMPENRAKKRKERKSNPLYKSNFFTKEERTGIIEAMNSLKETLDEAIPRAVKNQKKPV